MTIEEIREKIVSGVEYTLEAEPEHIPVRGNAMASGDDAVDKAAEDKILADLDAGNIWAWASVKVTAEWRGFTGVDYLGACSYKDEEDFEDSGEFNSMKMEALDDLVRGIKAMKEMLEDL